MNAQHQQMQQMQQDPDLKKVLASRASNIELTQHEFILNGCSARLTALLKNEDS